MNPLQRALIEKAGNDHGFEYILTADENVVHMGSARHRTQVQVVLKDSQYQLLFTSAETSPLNPELARSFPDAMQENSRFTAHSEEQLANILRRAAELARSLPNQAALDFESQVNDELAQYEAAGTKETEIERLVRQRVGQNTFRQAMLNYWGGACAVTGVAVPEVLRASHAKPWAECSSDAERLDVYNGFLLNANLDALFDRFMISFNANGELLVSKRLAEIDVGLLGIDKAMHLRWIAKEHLPYLGYHCKKFKDVDRLYNEMPAE